MKKLVGIIIIVLIMTSIVYADVPPAGFELPANPHGYIYTTVFRDTDGNDGQQLRVHYTSYPYRGMDGTAINDENADWTTDNIDGVEILYTKQSWYEAIIHGWDTIDNNQTSPITVMNAKIEYCNYNVEDLGGNTIVGNMDRFNQISWTLPSEGYQDVIKTINYSVYSKLVKAGSSYTAYITDSNGKPLSTNPDVKSIEIVRSTIASTPNTDGYYEWILQFTVDYVSKGTKVVGFYLEDNETNGKTYADDITINIKEFVDTDGNGRDDETGQDNYTPPSSLDNDGNLDLQGGIGTLTNAWSDMRQGVLVISSMIGGVFGWLPAPMQGLIYSVITILIIIGIMKIVRG